MPRKPVNPYDTAIHVRIKRIDKQWGDQTFFVLCDEMETIKTLKGRYLHIMKQIGFSMPKQEEELETKDLQFNLKNRVLDEDATCHDQQVFNDTVLYARFHIPLTKDDFEPL